MKVVSRDPYVHALRFSWLTPAYDLVVAATTRERMFRDALLRQAHIQDGSRVLDLACGTGTLAIRAKVACPSAVVVGVDGDPAILKRAARKALRQHVAIQFDQAMAENLPYESGSFDRVMSTLFFHHLPWNAKIGVAREVFRVLRPGGEFHVADWGPPQNALLRIGFLAVQVLDGFENTTDNRRGLLPRAFEQAGFANVRAKATVNTVLGSLTLYQALRRPVPK